MGNSLVKALGAGTLLQVLMVVVGYYLPALHAVGLFPIAGTLIGLVTGWLAGMGMPGAEIGSVATIGGLAGAAAGILGSLVSTALGDVPLGNVAIAGGSTLAMGALGGILAKYVGVRG